MESKSLQFWLDALGKPAGAYPAGKVIERGKTYDFTHYSCECCYQQNGPGTRQLVIMAVPKGKKGPLPAVVVPFYFPEAMLGMEIETRKPLEFYRGIEMLAHLAERGFIAVSAESYHLTYLPDLELAREDFKRWEISARQLRADHPDWSGMGKLAADTRLLVDLLCHDSRVDPRRIGIAGHSLGGKMAFYTGCLDPRIRVILASDFGLGWDQTNWDDIWYWGKEQVRVFKQAGIDHADLLQASGCKPFALLAGKYDNEKSLEILQSAGYADKPDSLCFINHAEGHRPPQWALDRGYDFLRSQLE